jgi:hypothetical protein
MLYEVYLMHPLQPYLPEHMRDAMKLYLEDRISPGSFLRAVLENNLSEAVSRADHINLGYLSNIVSFCYNDIPSAAWGSPEKVEAWLKKNEDNDER